MPLLLRKIRKSKWYKHSEVSWLPEGEIQADALVDLKTEDNSLSVWQVEDDRSNLNDLIAALASKCDALTNLDYALVDAGVISSLQLRLVQTEGDTPHNDVNNSWHHEVIHLSAPKVLEFAKAIFSAGETKRVLPRNIASLISNCVESGKIDKAKLSQHFRNKL